MVEVREKFNIKNLTAFKIGGEVGRVYFPKNPDEFSELPNNTKVFGNLSNTLISSYGYDGNIVLTTNMEKVKISGNRLVAMSGVKGPKLAQIAAENGLGGFEFMIGFPGSIGGEIAMNASAKGQCISDFLRSVTLFCPSKGIFKLNKDDMEFGYRTSICHNCNFVVLEAEFELEYKEKNHIYDKMKENLEFRKDHQPMLSLPNCGSVFKNPDNNSAGKLLDEVGVKGLKIGGAEVWMGHANFIVNSEKNATSKDVLELMAEMKMRVKNKFGIDLVPEIMYLGNKSKDEEKLCKILYQK